MEALLIRIDMLIHEGRQLLLQISCSLRKLKAHDSSKQRGTKKFPARKSAIQNAPLTQSSSRGLSAKRRVEGTVTVCCDHRISGSTDRPIQSRPVSVAPPSATIV